MKISFWGAAGTVTGSLHEVHAGGVHLILDCGLYQGRRKETRERNQNLPVDPKSLDAVLLSHAHIDHSGNLPSLARYGYQGPVYSTPATVDLCGAMLRDSAHIQEKDAEFLNKRRQRRRRIQMELRNGEEAVEPLYTMADAEALLPLFKQVPYHQPTELSGELTFETFDAGHMLGSSAIVLRERRDGREIRLAFSGDVGRKGLPIIRDPETLPPIDYLIMESTYGGRLHEPEEAVKAKLADVITRTSGRGGKLIVPAFAVGRTQQLVLLVHELVLEKLIPNIPIFVDSPLAVNVTEVFRKHPECYDQLAQEHLNNDRDPFGFESLKYIRDVAESKALNDLRFPAMIISASGMCEAGRILHHLRNNVEDPRNTILIPGFQAEHTLGRKIVERRAEIPIFGEPMRLRAEVVRLNALSGHADQQELLRWIKPLTPHLKKIFLVHGELTQSNALAQAIHEMFGISTVVAQRGESVTLS
jgi:metallo-beta-lactamase family protein